MARQTRAAHDPARDDGADGDRAGGHRGGFGDVGGASQGLIERTFRERIVLVGVTLAPADEDDTERSLDELALLVDTAGADEVARVVQRRTQLVPATYIGKGKADELRELADEVDADTVVFDDELTPAQQFNLEKILGRSRHRPHRGDPRHLRPERRTARRARPRSSWPCSATDLPRLRGKGRSAVSQQAGGIGTRGPGETQLEIDRRRLERRIHKLEAELRDIARHRDTQRKARRRSRVRTVAIVGYTNAGKSTLLNRLTDAGVLVEDRLFATLDATTRRLDLPGGEPVLLTDTVGFVRKLPHQLVEAFHSTLEVVAESDLLVHVVDASALDPDEQIDAVRQVLGEIGAAAVPELLVFNKCDVAPARAARLAGIHPGSVAISARTGEGVDALLRAVGDRLRALTAVVELRVPFDRGDVLASVHRQGEVLVEQAEADGMRLRARLDDAAATRLREFVVPAAGR